MSFLLRDRNILISTLLLGGILPLWAAPATPAAIQIWSELSEKRAGLSGYHQAFNVVNTSTTQATSQASTHQIGVDAAHDLWRETETNGSGVNVRIFDGQNTFFMEKDGEEYTRTKWRGKTDTPLPPAYDLYNPEWSKAEQLDSQPCRLINSDANCIVLKIPLKGLISASTLNKTAKMLEGVVVVMLEPNTGLMIQKRVVRVYQTQNITYQNDITYSVKSMTYNAPPEAALFTAPAGGLHQVSELSTWKPARVTHSLAGKPVPLLSLKDIEGNVLTLSSFKGKTVLLDFWTTWCPPCRRDAPSLEKLYRRYHDKDLMIVAISVSEERRVVEQYLKLNPHSFPVALTTENELPRALQVGVFPTYVVIDREGKVVSAISGDQGFSELKKLLKKAGLESE